MGKSQSKTCDAPQLPVEPSPKHAAVVVENSLSLKDVQNHDEPPLEQVDQVDQIEVQAPICIRNAFYAHAAECKTQRYCQSPDDITDEWLSNALNATVLSHVKTICGQGQLGLTVLVSDLKYVDGTGERPSSLAIKMHTQTEATLPFVQLLNSYSKELFFYTSFCQEIPLKYPKVLGVWTDANGADLTGDPVMGFNLMMENLCDHWDGFDPATKPPSLSEFERTILSLRPVHIKYWKSPIITQRPFSETGARFSAFEKFRPLMSAIPQAWPLVRSSLPKLAGWGEEFPPEFANMISFVDRFSADHEQHLRLLDVMDKVFQSRPMTLVHGDLNCGNVWKNKSDPEGDLLFADWQLLQMAPAACDWGTMLIVLPEGPTKEETFQMMKNYHAGLPPAMQEEYTLAQFYHDYKMQITNMTLLLSCFMVGQLDPSSMPEEKYKFTWTQFWPPIFRRLLQLYNDEGIEEFTEQLLDGEY